MSVCRRLGARCRDCCKTRSWCSYSNHPIGFVAVGGGLVSHARALSSYRNKDPEPVFSLKAPIRLMLPEDFKLCIMGAEPVMANVGQLKRCLRPKENTTFHAKTLYP